MSLTSEAPDTGSKAARDPRRADLLLRVVDAPTAGLGPALGGRSTYWSRPLPPDRFARLAQDMHRAIVAQAGSPDADDALLETVIGEAVSAFLSRAGHPVAAALKVGGLMRRIGAREAAFGRGFEVLDDSMRIARGAAEAYLPRLLAAHPMPEQSQRDMRADLGIFIDQLREHARVGFDRQWSMEETTPEHAELALRRLLFDDKTTMPRERAQLLAFHAGVVLPERVQPLIVLDGVFVRAVTHADGVLAGFSPHEVLLVEEASAERLQALRATLPPGAVLVVGDHVDLDQVPRALGLARRAAALVSTGQLTRPPGLLRCSEVLGQIATSSDPYLLDLLVAKHLSGFARMSPQRRVDMGELLLEWLETGDPVNEIARRRDRHTQTLHARMRTLRKILGDRLGDGAQRVELILALRRELPRWRAAGRRTTP